MMKAQGASEEEIKAQRAKIRQTDDDIDAFCDATGRARRQNREGVYTQRSFPDPDSYDPTTFEREQKETIEKYFSGGGSQTGYTFGQMKQNAETEKIYRTAKDYDDEIESLRKRRSEILNADTYTSAEKEESDKLLKRIFDLEDKRDVFVQNNPDLITNTVQNAANVAQKATQTPANAVKSSRGDIINQAVGISKGKKLSEAVAARDANPSYSTGKWEYRNNCQRCVQTYELRRRGYNVEAMPKIRRNDRVSWGSEIFNGYGTSKSEAIKAYTLHVSEQAVKDELSNAPNGARYSIYVRWKGRGAGAHVFVAEKSRGVVKYIDPQNGKMDVSNYFKDGKKGEFGFFRMDDKPLTKDDSLVSLTVRKGR
jgi:hypothetical protein